METAWLLVGALDASVRLCLLDALSAMAAEITAGGDLGSVEIRMHGREPEVVVRPTVAPARNGATPPAGEDDGGGDTARITLRLPESLKVQAEEAAGVQSISVNAWLVRAVAAALRGAGSAGDRPSPSTGRRGRNTISGFARS